jgi:hypothetical protein
MRISAFRVAKGWDRGNFWFLVSRLSKNRFPFPRISVKSEIN